jgi:Spy/CpxP family protein refolding chaperone
MNYFEKNKIYLYIIILLSAFVLSVGAALLYHTYNERHWSKVRRGMERPVNSHRMMANQLGLNTEQWKQFHKLRADYFEQTKNLISAIESKKAALLTELALNTPDTIKLDAITDSIGILHHDLMKATAGHFLLLKKICTPEQQVKMQELFKHMLQNQGQGRSYNNRHGSAGKEEDRRPYTEEGYGY